MLYVERKWKGNKCCVAENGDETDVDMECDEGMPDLDDEVDNTSDMGKVPIHGRFGVHMMYNSKKC